jgi:hypothetical protein
LLLGSISVRACVRAIACCAQPRRGQMPIADALDIAKRGFDPPDCSRSGKAPRRFKPRSLDSESKVPTVTPRGQVSLLGATGRKLPESAVGRAGGRRTAQTNRPQDAPSRRRVGRVPAKTPTVGLEPTSTRLRALRSADYARRAVDSSGEWHQYRRSTLREYMRSEQRKLQPRTDAAEAERTLPAARFACLVAAIDEPR